MQLNIHQVFLSVFLKQFPSDALLCYVKDGADRLFPDMSFFPNDSLEKYYGTAAVDF